MQPATITLLTLEATTSQSTQVTTPEQLHTTVASTQTVQTIPSTTDQTHTSLESSTGKET